MTSSQTRTPFFLAGSMLPMLCLMIICPLLVCLSTLQAQSPEKPIKDQILSIVERYDSIGSKPDEYDYFSTNSLDVALSILKGGEEYYKGGIIYFISKVFRNHQKNLSTQEQNRIIGEMLFEVRKLEPKITIMTLMHFKEINSHLITAFAKEMLGSPDEDIRYVAAKFFSNEPDPDEPLGSAESPARAEPSVVEPLPLSEASPSASVWPSRGLAAAVGILATILWLARKACRRTR